MNLLVAVIATVLVVQCCQCMNITGTFIPKDGEQLSLLQIASKQKIDTVILMNAVGVLVDFDNDTCVNTTLSLTSRDKEDLVVFVSRAMALNVTVYLGQLQVESLLFNQSLITQWSVNCTQVIASLQIEAAQAVEELLGKVFQYHWYIPQQIDLNSIQVTDDNCDNDAQVSFIRQVTDELHSLNANRNVLVSPFFLTKQSAVNLHTIAHSHEFLLRCAPHITYSSPFDGLSSLSNDITLLKSYFKEIASAVEKDKLWLTMETFQDDAHLCAPVSKQRTDQEIDYLHPYVQKVINYWAYNLKGAPKCEL